MLQAVHTYSWQLLKGNIMKIRLRSTGEVMYEGEFRTRFAQNLPPTPLTQEWLNTYTSDPAGDILLEVPQATTV